YLFSMAFLSFNVKKRYADRLEFDNYVSTKLKKQVENKKKLPSVAAIYRVKNGAEYIEASILSISSFATQIIVVDNNSMDNTKNIVEKLSNELRDVCDIKLFSYNKKLAIAGSGYIDRVSNGDGSLAEF
ncbi:glycosyltransferase, partial [Salmonella enterica]|nr:glycosyltransferase [Salmonella enterica]